MNWLQRYWQRDKGDLARAEARAARADALAHEYHIQLCDRTSALEEMTARLNWAHEENGKLNQQLADLRSEVIQLRQQAQSLRTAKAIWDAVGALERDLDRLKAQCREFRDKIGKAYEIDDAIRN